MNDLNSRIADLSPAKRALLELRLNMRGVPPSAGHAIPRRANRDQAPLSFAQQRLWFLDQLEPESPLYNISKAIRLSGPVNVQALEKALDAIVARHEILRTNIVAVDGHPVQVVTAKRSIKLVAIDLSEQPDSDRAAKMHRLINAEARRPFDLSSDLMLRATLIGLGEKDHALVLVLHHIASDGWSMSVLLTELSALYKAFAMGNPSPLPELPIQYADYAIWQRQWLQGEIIERQLSYWKQRLSGAPAILELPTDRPRLTVRSSLGARQSFRIPKELTEALKKLSQQERVTLFMTLLAAFQTLLYRYTGQENFVVGSPIAGRNRAETESLIGFFVNTLALRTDVSGSLSFRQLIARVREVALEAYTHQDLPFEKLVEELQPDRSRSHTPLFQVIFALQNVPRQPFGLTGLTVSPLEVDSATAKFDLSLSLVEEGSSLRGSMEYNSDLFENATITRMLGHYQTLLQAIVANPEQRLADLPILTEREKHQLLVEWNDTGRDYPRDKCIHQLFEAQVERSPDAVAVIFENQRLTYRELNQRANQLAHCLQKLGVAPEVRVGIYMERSVDMIVGLLGILKAGAVYVPLDLGYPKERLTFMLGDSQAPVLLAQRRLLDKLPEYHGDIICLDTDLQLLSNESECNPPSRATAENLAYVIYTSGSTGKPKGVAVSHRAVNRLLVNTNYVNLQCTDVVAQASNCSFDAATFEIWGALLHGAQLVGVRTDVVLSPKDFAKQIERQRISVLFLTTALLNQIARDWPTAFKNVRHLLFGGEAVDPRWVREILKHGPPERLLHVYGPTETTTFASWYLVEGIDKKATTIPIGRPIANTQIYVLDSHLEPVSVGVVGELYIGGEGLACGYLNRPELTAETFIPNPYSDDSSARLYRTGDLVRYLSDGNVEFIGRKDFQVKIRGFRIELGEVENVLSQHPAVQQVTLLARHDTGGEKRLVAYLVLHQQATATVGELRRFLQAKVPDYMVPSAFVFVDTLPLTPNGKVDRRALPAPDQSRPEKEPRVAPRNAVERQLTKIWEKILGIQPIGVKDNFFDLGGHSLLAVRVVAEIEKALGKNIPLATLFQAPTIEQLADALNGKESLPSWSWLVPFQTAGSKPPFFCLHGGGTELAKLLGADQPLYGLRPHGQDGRRAPFTVEDMAADYIKEIRTVQPEGPYYIGGYSFGGMVAFEVAQQLQNQGQELALLALLDPTKPTHREPLPLVPSSSQPSSIAVLYDEVRQHLRSLARLGFRGQLAYLGERVGWRIEGIKRFLKMMTCGFCLAIGRRVPFNLRMFYFFEVSYQTARRYAPQAYAGSIVLFHTQKPSNSSQFDWPTLAAAAIKIHEIPGKHLEILKEPYVQVLAEQLKKYLD
jgi:amino acid adenylation domain-containing protein